MNFFLRKFRRLNQFYAWLKGYYWSPCPICGKMYGGHEHANIGIHTSEPVKCDSFIERRENGILVSREKFGHACHQTSKFVCWKCGEIAKKINNSPRWIPMPEEEWDKGIFTQNSDLMKNL